MLDTLKICSVLFYLLYCLMYSDRNRVRV